MERILFECKLLSDVVLKSSTATEGFINNLDYISGAKFLGIAAKELYDENNPEKTLDIFHNGKTQFGDAHVAIDGKRSIKAPAVWFFKKGEGIGEEKFLHHKLSTAEKKNLSERGIQLKQARTGFFEGGKFTILESNFTIKSAYDSNLRKSKNSQMYGYYALPKGSAWLFNVDTKVEYAKEIISALEGKKRIGRSRSAEYGLAEISVSQQNIETKNKSISPGEICIYADSNLCFYDEFGQNTLQPTVKQLGLSNNSEIIWSKSQVRSRKYQTWNSKRYNRDADRMIIEKGSVFVIKTNTKLNTSDFKNGIGAHKNEGFGKVIFNPDFLMSDTNILDLELVKHEFGLDDTKYFIEKGSKDDLIKDFLQARSDEKERVVKVDELVNDFKMEHENKYNGITASQWGQVRNYAKHAANEAALKDLLFAKEVGYFMHGQSEHKWRTGNRRSIMEEYLFGKRAQVPQGSKLEFIQKISRRNGQKITIKN